MTIFAFLTYLTTDIFGQVTKIIYQCLMFDGVVLVDKSDSAKLYVTSKATT